MTIKDNYEDGTDKAANRASLTATKHKLTGGKFTTKHLKEAKGAFDDLHTGGGAVDNPEGAGSPGKHPYDAVKAVANPAGGQQKGTSFDGFVKGR